MLLLSIYFILLYVVLLNLILSTTYLSSPIFTFTVSNNPFISRSKSLRYLSENAEYEYAAFEK